MSFKKYLREGHAETLSRKASLAKYLDDLEPTAEELERLREAENNE